MHICVVPHYFPARSETFVLEHVRGLVRRGHRVTIVARLVDSAVSELELQQIDRLGVERHYLGDHPSRISNTISAVFEALRNPRLTKRLLEADSATLRRLLLAVAVARQIRACRPDVVHFHFGDHAARLQSLASFLPPLPPVLVTWHGYDANAVPRIMGADVYKDLFTSDVRHTVGSQFIQNRLLTLGARESAISVIPMGIDLQKFAYVERSVDTETPLTILTVGRLDAVKGHTFLIEAVGRLVKKGMQVRLRIIGDGRLRRELERQIAAESLESNVTLLGAVPSAQVVEEMRAAHLFALTGVAEDNGKVESQGLVYAEAQATGLPVIGSNLGGVPDSMVDGLTGRLCSPGDVASIETAIEYFVIDRAAIVRFGVRGREFVEQAFSLERMLDRFEAVYAELSKNMHVQLE